MAGKITALRHQRRTQERVNVYLDGEYAFPLPVLEAAQLRIGQELSDADIARLKESDIVQKAYERAVRFLSYRPRSRVEVERNLAGADIDPNVIEAVVQRLTQQGLLNDAEFARFWIENREQFKPRGERALRQELRQKGIDDGVSVAALSGLDSEESAYRAAQPRALRLAALAESDRAAFRQKLSNFLLRRGFSYEEIRQVVARLEAELGQTRAGESDEDIE